MALKDFSRKEGIPIAEIRLDESNVRFDVPPGSQIECQRRLLQGSDGKKLLTLAEHIAANGIGLTPIVVSKDQAGMFTVRDGNRRIAALKFLNNPSGCPVDQYKDKFAQIRSRFASHGNIISTVGCWIGHSEDAIFEHIDLQHAGQMDGAGQVPLETLARDRLKTRRLGKMSRHGQVNGWLQGHEHLIPGIENLDLTNIQRLVGKKKNLGKLGFIHDSDGIVRPCKNDEEIAVIWKCLLTRVKGVGDIYYASQRDPIIDSAVEEARVILGVNRVAQSHSDEPISRHNSGTPTNQTGVFFAKNDVRQEHASKQGATFTPVSTSPRKPSTDRNRLIVAGRHTISIPPTHWKARNVLFELKKLDVKEFPIAVAMLLRSLMEHTLYAYCQAKGLISDSHTDLKQLLGLVVKDCENSEKIRSDKKKSVLHRIGNWKEMDSLTTLNICIHDAHYYLPAKDLCALYEQYDYFFTYWWNEVATAK